MAPKKNTDNGGASAPLVSDNHIKLIDSMFKASPPSAKQSINWTATSKLTGHKDAKSCRETFRQACEKYGWFKAEEDENNNNDGTPGSASAKKNNPKKPTKGTKKNTPAKDTAADVSGDEVESPTKKRKGKANNGLETPMKKTKLSDEAKDEVMDEAKEEAKEEHANEV
ncbi:hypothetical protein PG994_007689 [Apiospora phragmitis]|uniref:Uncharacterized protein n=1 Tax=Apiospora phragmitis TaxID=2905665 RepID=A0ABR1UU16_9PEZI